MKKYDFLVLGADGLQGVIAARLLLERGYSVFCADLYKTKIQKIMAEYGRGRSAFSFVDLRDISQTARLMKKSGADTVVNCAEMDWNLNVYNAALEANANCVDLGAWIELTARQLKKNHAFKKIGCTAITGCGAVPGIGNVMLRYASRKLDTLESVDVGFAWASNKKDFVVPFSIKSILEELTYRPSFVKQGKMVNKKPLEVSFERRFRLVGRERVYMVQHPELFTFRRYFMEQGLSNIRFFAGFPPHSLQKIQTLIELGFYKEKPILLEGIKIAPLFILPPVLKELGSPPGYTERENLWLDIKGAEDGKKKRILMECLVPPIKGWESSGGNIDTG
ncbi:MAG: saccharopine dehydrogenase NADP-binding domain-containing protein, partial [Patescibacteria group bacterium]